jgi:galactonate dehydratase
MKIERITTYLVEDWLLVTVETDTGIKGVGQSTFWGQPAATVQVIDEFRRYLIGKNPLTIDYHYQYLNRSSSFRASSVFAALSAIDVALWDIAGKHCNMPVHGLLGGTHRSKIRMCALCMDGDIDGMVAQVRAAVASGHTAVKIDPFPPEYGTWTLPRLIREVVDRVGAVREAIGEDVDLVIEAHRKLGPAEAIALAAKLEPFDVGLLEDPIPPDSVDSMAEVAARTTIPIATGERLHTIYEFREVLSRGAARDLKLDAGLQGGFTQTKKIAALAEAYHATVSPHNAWGPVLTAIHVQLAAAIPNFLVLEYRPDEKDDIAVEPLKVRDGYITVPETPGIGIELDEKAVARYSYTPRDVGTALRSDGSVAFR